MQRIIFCVLVAYALPTFCHTIKETVIKYTEEKINGLTFTLRMDICDGQVKERRAIDNKPISAQEYEQARQDAINAEYLVLRKQEEERKLVFAQEEAKKQEFNLKARLNIHRKEIALLIPRIEADLQKIKNPTLEAFLSYEPLHFPNQEAFLDIERTLLPEARRVLETYEFTEADLATMVAKLEKVPGSLDDMFKATVKNAINMCNDTKLLKELLDTVAEGNEHSAA